MEKIKVKVIETLERVVEVEADTFEDAASIVECKYRHSEIVLDEGDYAGVEFFPA